MTERERHDFTASELTEEREAHAAERVAHSVTAAALRKSEAALARSDAALAKSDRLLAEANATIAGLQTFGTERYPLSERLPPPLGTARVAPSDQQIQDDHLERRGGR